MKKYLNVFKALSDKTRLRIMHLLLTSRQELCVCELVDALEEPYYNISRHLKLLEHLGLVAERKEGRWVYYFPAMGDEEFEEGLAKAIASLSDATLSRDARELKKRLTLREDGKCLIGIQKPRLMHSR